jgi:hypothetical protein
MIPVIGVPVLTHPDLLYSMLASVDTDVVRVYIVDNGGVVDLARVCGDIYVPGRNLGVAASWNNIISSNPDAPWWMITNFDVEFERGDLSRLSDHMDSVGGLALLPDFAAFGVSRSAIEAAGTFDENFHPAYFEDNDFYRRCLLAGVDVVGLPASTRHRRSSTLESSDALRQQNARTFPSNSAYFERKWGGPPHHEVFTTPFNAGGDIRSWQLDESRVAAQSWT